MTVTEAGIAIGSGSKTPSSWTPERVEMLREIWPRGYSASQTASMIGGVTRCAVIGKVHRLKLPVRPQDNGGRRAIDPDVLAKKKQAAHDRSAHRQRVRRADARGDATPEFKPSAGPAIAASPAYEGSLRLEFADLVSGQCLFPEGSEVPFAFCGTPVAGGTSWCAHHQQIVWVKPEQRRATSYDANRRGRKVSNFVGSHEAV